jgi:DNA-nicking Smr family endonuclease
MAALSCHPQSQTATPLHRASYRDILLHRNLQEAPLRSTHSNLGGQPTLGSLTAAASAPAAPAPAAAAAAMALVLEPQHLQRQVVFDAECSDDELYQLCMASNHCQGPTHDSDHHHQQQSPFSCEAPSTCHELQQQPQRQEQQQQQQQQHPSGTFWHPELASILKVSSLMDNSMGFNNAFNNAAGAGCHAHMLGATVHDATSTCCCMDLDRVGVSPIADSACQQGQASNLAGQTPATATEADRCFTAEVLRLANKFKLDASKCLDLCCRVPFVVPQCAIRIYQCCLCDVDAAAAACMLGSGGLSSSASCGSSAAVDHRLASQGIVECMGDRPGGAVPPTDALSEAECLHKQANDALAIANQWARAALCCGMSSDARDLQLSEAAARKTAASLRAEAHAASFTAYNCTVNTWHVNLCGLTAADAADILATQLRHILSLEHPGGVLMCVVTGLACNDTIEQTVMLECGLLSCISDQGGVACPDSGGIGSRGGRIGNVVVAFIRVDPSLHVVDVACMEAATAAACEARQIQLAWDLQRDAAGQAAAQHSRSEDNMSGATAWHGAADTLTKEARLAMWRQKTLIYMAHNSSFGNYWSIDLHGQSEATAVSIVQQYLLSFKAMGHPGGITLKIITGKGKHSANQIAKVRPAVLRFLQEDVPRDFHCDDGQAYTLCCEDRDGLNDGVVLVSISPKGGPV